MLKDYFGIFSGHSQLKDGRWTCASGELHEGMCNEDVAKAVDKWLKIGGGRSDLYMIPRKHLSSKAQEEDYKIPKANSKAYTCIVEIHFNAFQDKDNPMGTECLYYPGANDSKVFAQRVNDRLDDVFKDRQIKTDNLYMLRETNSPAIIVEVCFCDSASDANIYNKYGADYIGKLIAEGLLNKTIDAPSTGGGDKPKVYPNGDYNRKARVVKTGDGFLSVRTGRGTKFDEIGRINEGDIIEVNYCLNNWFSTWSYHNKEGYVSGTCLELL